MLEAKNSIWRLTNVCNEEYFFSSREEALICGWDYFLTITLADEVSEIRNCWKELRSNNEIEDAVWIDEIQLSKI